MMALSVMWMLSGHTSVQHFVMLHRPSPELPPDEVASVDGVERVHVERGESDEEARSGVGGLVLLVVTDDVADVLAKEALDALAELLGPVDVELRHAVGAVRGAGSRRERGDLLRHREVERDVGDEVPR